MKERNVLTRAQQAHHGPGQPRGGPRCPYRLAQLQHLHGRAGPSSSGCALSPTGCSDCVALWGPSPSLSHLGWAVIGERGDPGSRQEYWKGWPCFLQGIFPTQDGTSVYCIASTLYHLSHQRIPKKMKNLGIYIEFTKKGVSGL